jgi:tetratricopeptide (TPR) repeat protein
MTSAPKLFVSYRRTRMAEVRPVVEVLTNAGVDCFFDIDDIDPLADFPERIREGIDASHAALIWCSSDYGESDHCLAEFVRAWQHARRRSSDVGRRVWVLNPEPTAHHIFAGELNSKNFLVPPTVEAAPGWTRGLVERLKALLPEGPLADERRATPVPTLRNVPQPNQRFTGRGATLLRLHSKFFPAQIGSAASARGIYLHGMGGLGKTEVAARYAREFAQAFPGGVFWLNLAGFKPNGRLDTAAAKRAGALALDAVFANEPKLQARLLRNANGKLLEPEQARELVASWLDESSPSGPRQPYLWVLDNVPQMTPLDARNEVLSFWRAPTASGRTLLTTHDARIASGFVQESLHELDDVDALRLLACFRPIKPNERDAASALATEVGKHTLALILLGERVGRDGDYAATLDTLRSTGRLVRLEQIAGRLRPELGAAARSVVATFQISIEPLSKGAKRLLALAAVCAPNEPIPRGLLRGAYGADSDADVFADAIHALVATSLLSERRGPDSVDIHPLVADVAAQLLNVNLDKQGEEVAKALVPRIADAAGDIRRHPALAGDITHARLLADRMESSAGVELGNRVAEFEFVRGHYSASARVIERAYEIGQRVLGERHPYRLRSMSNLATIRLAQGDWAQAQMLLEQVVDLRRDVLTEAHPDTLTSMSNLSEARRIQGDLPGARALAERVIAVRSRVLGEKHAHTLMSMLGLAVILKAQDELPEARAMQERVLEFSRQEHGEEHPATLQSMNGLGITLLQEGDLPGARALLERALEIRCRVLGEEHPDTLISMNNLAGALGQQGDLRGARVLFDRALEVKRRVLGEEHPDTLTAMSNLATVLSEQGDLPGARELLERVLFVCRRVSGEEHPRTLAAAMKLREILEEALPQAKRQTRRSSGRAAKARRSPQA